MSAIDYYSPAAEFFDLVGHRHLVSSAPALRAALTGLDTAHGPVLDIGAGTGLVTSTIAEILPSARILSAEPSPVMRAVLTSRVFSDPALRERVTVLPEPAQELPLPDSLSAVVIFGVAGHIPRSERVALWRRLADRLPPGGPIVVELMGVETPRSIPFVRMCRERVGEQVYEWWISGEPAGEGVMRWRTEWRVLRDGERVRTVTDEYDWETFGVDRLAEESGLTVKRLVQAGREATPEIGVLVK
ncbi:MULTISPECIES: class I SAM-dependent methyltransferase [Nocardiopsis]|uniref:Class I SAM-dependent methyltransferase n=1 Tax=Nocardiopsis lambiniae TaxID=3075539 RepID=A0ABU2MF87_9ACTN|nr:MULTISPECIES: class I SAM-dependent methyltransferase [unclassified Nocardiopsis]MDE3722950.1 class I SAM-dependent methyltransferase [Nocardiopsis sp. N85]MDT0331195.1 class I SAM-dependent methyltransferase [Nocardiopsis sp. DSM 44743]